MIYELEKAISIIGWTCVKRTTDFDAVLDMIQDEPGDYQIIVNGSRILDCEQITKITQRFVKP